MESIPNQNIAGGNSVNLETGDLKRISELELSLKQTGLSRSRDRFHLLLFRIYGTATPGIISRLSEYFSRSSSISTQDLIREFREHLKSPKRIHDFEEWLRLVTKRGLLEPKELKTEVFSRPEPKREHELKEKLEDNLIEQRIASAQREQSEIEQNLSMALFSRDFGLNIDVKKDKYGLPEYHILSKNGNKLGMIRFSTEYEKDEEVNILEFVKFSPADKPTGGKVLATLSNMGKENINHFVQTSLVELVGSKADAATQK